MARFRARVLLMTAILIAFALVFGGLVFMPTNVDSKTPYHVRNREEIFVKRAENIERKEVENIENPSLALRKTPNRVTTRRVEHDHLRDEIERVNEQDGQLNKQIDPAYEQAARVNEAAGPAHEQAGSQKDRGILTRSHYTLVTDDNTTRQDWGWKETIDTQQECAGLDYTQEKLPDLSVIICFHGQENVSNVLHTVHGVYQRTPSHILREVILIDDNSNNEDFGQTLELYVDVIFQHKVRIIRSTEKLGLIRARLLGIQAAKGEVVAVMDSHVEVQHRWAEPLLKEIVINPKTLAASYLDWMTKRGDIWEYRYGGSTWKSYFDWTYVFGWQMMSKKESDARKSLTQPIPSPVIIGTIFANKKSFFEAIGGFDPGMQLWGGENLDLPVRVWLCGGRVVNCPCSRAGHLEAHGHRDYRLNADFTNAKNTNYKRFTEVWVGDYKKYFYLYTPDAGVAKAGDLSSRLKLKSICTRDFSWFLKNVFPELGIPDENSLAWGKLQNTGTDNCLDTRVSLLPGVDMCGTGNNRQGVFWSNEYHLRFPLHVMNNKDLANMGYPRRGLYLEEYMSQYNMTTSTEWFHWENGPIIDIHTNECLTSAGGAVVFQTCNLQSPNQQWHFEHYSKEYYDLISGNSTFDPSYRQTLINALLYKYSKYLPKYKHATRRPDKGPSQNIKVNVR